MRPQRRVGAQKVELLAAGAGPQAVAFGHVEDVGGVQEVGRVWVDFADDERVGYCRHLCVKMWVYKNVNIELNLVCKSTIRGNNDTIQVLIVWFAAFAKMNSKMTRLILETKYNLFRHSQCISIGKETQGTGRKCAQK